jgi:hypothetical protein
VNSYVTNSNSEFGRYAGFLESGNEWMHFMARRLYKNYEARGVLHVIHIYLRYYWQIAALIEVDVKNDL